MKLKSPLIFIVSAVAMLQAAPAKPMTTLDALKSYANAAYAKFDKSAGSVYQSLYFDALVRIDEAHAIIDKKPQSPEAIAAFNACSLSVEAAVVQLSNGNSVREALALQKQTSATLDSINRIHEKIATIEKSNSAKLKSDLDSANVKSSAFKDEADRLKAEADKMRAEADKKFSELQSSLIKVSNDARGTIISMSDILFETGKADLTPDLKTSLAKIAGILIVFKTSNVAVEGHTDNQGSADFNQKLSEMRAQNVMNFLVAQGVDASRLSYQGFGFSKPIADNATKDGRQKNRRVDLVVQEIKN